MPTCTHPYSEIHILEYSPYDAGWLQSIVYLVVSTAWTYGQRSVARYMSDPDLFHPTRVPLHDWAPISNQASDREHPKL